MIDFSKPKPILMQEEILTGIAQQVMRPISRKYDDLEETHERPREYIEAIWRGMQMMGLSGLEAPNGNGSKPKDGKERPPIGNQMLMHIIERLSYGDAGIYLCTPGGALGGAAVAAAGTPEQKKRFLARFSGGEPKWGAMAMTEPHAGSDTAAIRTRATLSEDRREWILNGEKIFVTGGLMAAQESDGFVVVWATVDPSLGRAGMKPFVVEARTPGMTVTKLEKKMGIRASDTAAIHFEECRIPFENVLGDPELATPEAIREKAASKEGFRGAMATFDATRPAVAASAIGIGNAALEFVKQFLAREGVEIRYGLPYQKQSAIERDLIRMEGELKAAWLLTLKAAWMMDQKLPNNLEASMCKVKAGEAVTWVTQKAVEIMGPEGYSTKHLVEKWMRDAKINDIYEGTGQVNRMVVARNILGYRSSDLR